MLKNMPRILYCSDTFPPQVNGVSVVTELSVEGLARRGWECEVIAPRYADSLQDAIACGMSRVPVHSVASVPFPAYPDIRIAAPYFDLVKRVARRFAPNVVHSATEFVIGRMGQMAAKSTGAVKVSSFHTDFARYAEAYGLPFLRSPVSQYLMRYHRRSRRVFTPSKQTRNELQNSGLNNVEVWGSGVDTSIFSPAKRSFDLRGRFPANSFLFLHVGRLAAEKGVGRILEAYSRVREVMPPDSVHLIIAGAGPQESAIRIAAPDGVTFLGVLDRKVDLPALYASCDAFVFASTTETLGLVILEAMASGLPVIAAPAGGVADNLDHGINGLAYDPGNVEEMARAMVLVATTSGLAEQLSLGALETATGQSWDRALDRLDESYRELLPSGANKF